MLLELLKNLRHLKRYRQIINVLARYGFSEALVQLKVKRIRQFFSFRSKKASYETLASRPTRLRLALEELGPAFVKIGQILSTRFDLLPPAYIEEFSKLQDQVSPFPDELAVQAIEMELGLKVEQLFKKFGREHFASASLSQVYLATLQDGIELAIKIKRPLIEPQILQDLEILKNGARFIEKNTPWGRIYNLIELAEEIEQMLLQELDFRSEARNAERFRRNFENSPLVFIPRVYWEFSTRNILALEYRSGIKLYNILEKSDFPVDRRKIAENLADAFFNQVFVHGFFHGDPHPGNIIVLPGEQVMFVDFGTAGIINEDLRDQFQSILRAILMRNADEIAEGIIDLGFSPVAINRRQLGNDLKRLQEKYYQVPLGKIEIRELMQDFIKIVSRHKVRLPHGFLLLIKSLATLESIISQLDPQFMLFDVFQKHSSTLKKEFFTRGKRKVKDLAVSYERFLTHFPVYSDKIMRQAAEGEFKVQIELVHTETFLKRIGNMVNRLSFSIVLASLIVGLSLIIWRTDFYLLQHFPLAEAALIVAGAAGFWWLISILRSEK